MKSWLDGLLNSRTRFGCLMSVSIMSMMYCYLSVNSILLACLELVLLGGCVLFFKKNDVTLYKFIQSRPSLFWRVCEWYWAIYFSLVPFLNMLNSSSESMCVFDYLFPCRYCLCLKPLFSYSVASLYCTKITLLIAVLLTLPFWLVVMRWLFYHISLFFNNMTRFEIIAFSVMSTILFIVLITLASTTSFFVYPVDKETYVSENNTVIQYQYDGNENHFLDSDTGGLLSMPYYTIGDFSRHPYCSRVMTLFFPLLLMLGTAFNLFFSSYAYSFAIGICIVQVLLYSCTAILLMRLYEPIANSAFSKSIGILYFCSFPVVFVFCPERLIFSSFFVVLAVYLILQSSVEDIYQLFVSVLAIGMTSLSLLPIGFAYFLKRKFIWIILMGIPLILLTFHNGLAWWHDNKIHFESTWTTPYHRITSYNQLLESCFIVPQWHAVDSPLKSDTMPDGKSIVVSPKQEIETTLQSSYLRSNIIGSLIFLLCCTAVWLYRKNSIVQVSFFWFAVSVGVVCIVGFGNSQCVLYNTYFSWAILPLAILPFYWFWKKFPKIPVFHIIYALGTFLFIENLYFLWQVIQIVGSRYIIPSGI